MRQSARSETRTRSAIPGVLGTLLYGPLLALLTLSACGNDATIEPGTQAVQSRGAAPPPSVEQLVPSLRAKTLEGTWKGLLNCAGRGFPTQLVLSAGEQQSLNVRWTVSPSLGRRSYPSPDGRTEIKDRILAGTFDPISGWATVREEAPGRPLQLDLLLAEDGALLRYGRCESGVLEPAPATEIAELERELVTIQEPVVIEVEDQQGECPAELEQWIEAGLALPLDSWGRGDTSSLWTNAVTEPIFGQPVETMDARRRIELRRALQGRCGVRGDRRRNGLVNTLALITDYRSFSDSVIGNRARALARRWLAERAEPLLAATPAPNLSRETASALNRVPRSFDFETLFADQNEFSLKQYALRLVALNDALTQRRRLEDYLANMRGADFFRLQELWSAALFRDDVDNAAATNVAREHLLPAAKSFAADASDARDARAMADWIAGVEAGVLCEETTLSQCHAAAKTFDRRVTKLARSFEEIAARELEALSKREETLPTLAALIDSDRKLQQTYGGVLGYGAFPEQLEDRRKLRYRLQREQEKALAGQLGSAGTTAALAALENRYFAAGDLSARPERHLRRLGEILDEQLTGTRPFSGTGADAYLNALYNKEFATLARMDAELLAGVIPAFRFLAAQVNTISGLLGSAGQPLTERGA
jgi:hypothetical protein